MRRLLRRNGVVIRSKTHEAQTHPSEKMAEGRVFVARIVPSINQPNRHQSFLANMDQTPIFFSMTPNTTLETAGVRTVNVRPSSGSTTRLTLAVFVTAAGEVLTPYIRYKGKAEGRIARDFQNPQEKGYPGNCYFACQERAWMDERCCLDWVTKCLNPWADMAPPGVLPLLLLDQYKCHLMASVVQAIHNLGVEKEFIPGGCTSLTQPVDVGINKPLKNRVRSH